MFIFLLIKIIENGAYHSKNYQIKYQLELEECKELKLITNHFSVKTIGFHVFYAQFNIFFITIQTIEEHLFEIIVLI